MKSSLSLKHSLANVQKRIDDSNEFYPLLDYSFHDAEKIEDAVSFEPRVAPGAPNVIKVDNRYHSYGINLNHNKLNGSLETLPNLIRKIFINPNALAIIDLSFNAFTEIPIAITQFPLLKHFLFHKNLLRNLNEIEKLYALKELKHLTLHRNPIEDNISYLRSYVLCLLPGLRSFNCTSVSKSDLKTSDIWQKMNKTLIPKILNK
ncbi:unnamed protein product [Rotaria sordida]|uniref:Leucine-rich repeat-containing protein 51 n=1 Tax=Rotaria sordida TaxID=392033 RepID=A0A814WLV6_9BILA|nr:unnamed protein product [Rotaria sordida]CAF1480579.1 unnamed protein product [Rotaria sordida]